MSARIVSYVLMMSLLVLAGCANQHLRPQRYNAASSAPYLLDSGDRLRVTVFGQQNLTNAYSVDGGGNISMPLIGTVRARGKTVQQLESGIAAKLRQGYLRNPDVSVQVETYRPFFILGEVRNPGQYPYVNGMTVETAVAIAGGYTPRAQTGSAYVTRERRGKTAGGKVSANYPLRPGDTVKVEERFF